jgi:hypothetical protein
MISDIIEITNTGENLSAALDVARKVAAYGDLSPKNTLHLRLLAEELMSLMHAITGEVSGRFWIEKEEEDYRLHLQVDAALTKEKREGLLAASTTGKNEAHHSFMGRLRDFFFGPVDAEIASYDRSVLATGVLPDGSRPSTDWDWMMTRYQGALSAMKEETQEAAEAWDELEKSIVGNLADDVKVSIKGSKTEMTIDKKLA